MSPAGDGGRPGVPPLGTLGQAAELPALTLTSTLLPGGAQEARPESGQRAAGGTEGEGRAGWQQNASHGELGTALAAAQACQPLTAARPPLAGSTPRAGGAGRGAPPSHCPPITLFTPERQSR